jgi:predicted nucleotidyltransferase
MFIGEALPRLRWRFASLRAMIFGSRTRGDALSTSDLDVILVSPTFRSIPFLQRAVVALEALEYPGGLELALVRPPQPLLRRCRLTPTLGSLCIEEADRARARPRAGGVRSSARSPAYPITTRT